MTATRTSLFDPRFQKDNGFLAASGWSKFMTIY